MQRVILIVFIGNSITFGAGLCNPAHHSPPFCAALYLSEQPSVAAVDDANQGICGAMSVDFLPDRPDLWGRAG